MCRSEELDRRHGLTSELDEMWSYVRRQANPRWLWHAIDHHTGKVLGYVFGPNLVKACWTHMRSEVDSLERWFSCNPDIEFVGVAPLSHIRFAWKCTQK